MNRAILSRARKQAVLALFLATELAAMTVSSQGLVPHHVAGDVRVTAPTLHFLTGKSLSQLHDGAGPLRFSADHHLGIED